MATLWNKGVSATERVDAFTVGNDRVLDLKLAKYDIIGSKAHIRMLESIGLLTREELKSLTAALDEIAASVENGTFVLEDDVEDIHS
ncbi:MAG: argininosuccinate lyase, partial [Alistipes sp.]|nr:argininosuccinate lyase [Candidatus Minthomonas equi]